MRDGLFTCVGSVLTKPFSPSRYSLNLLTARIWCKACKDMKSIRFFEVQPKHFDGGRIREKEQKSNYGWLRSNFRQLSSRQAVARAVR